MKKTVCIPIAGTPPVIHDDETQALDLLRQALRFAADGAQERANQLEGLEYVGMQDAATWLEAVANGARHAFILTTSNEAIEATTNQTTPKP